MSVCKHRGLMVRGAGQTCDSAKGVGSNPEKDFETFFFLLLSWQVLQCIAEHGKNLVKLKRGYNWNAGKFFGVPIVNKNYWNSEKF